MTVRDIDKGWQNIVSNLKILNNSATKVGLQKGDTHEGKSIAEYAAYNEFGTKNIPSRPFMRNAFDKNKTLLYNFVDTQYNNVLARRLSARNALGIVGQYFQNTIQKSIEQGGFESNDPKTIKQKGSSKPLIDTGTMRNSIRHVEVF
jgi:hypothetical protein